MAEVDSEVLGKYEIQNRIGKGAYGIVWKAVERTSRRAVAVKKIFDAFRNKTDAQRTFREVMFLREFGRHPNVVRLLDVMRASNNLDLYLVLEYMDSDLHEVIKRGDLLKDVHRRYIMHQLLDAVGCLHAANVIHRDLKPSNILIDSDCRIRVADFGLARSLSHGEDEDADDPPLTEYVATRWYRAPEILLADKWYTTGVDMWSVGCILGEMLLGRSLFPGTSTVNQMERIMAAIPPPTNQDIRSMCSGYALTLLERAASRPKRALADAIPAAPDDAVDLLVRLLLFNPTKRLSADQALAHPYVDRIRRPQSKSTEPIRIRHSVPFEDAQLTVDGYRNQLYRLIDENRWQETLQPVRPDPEGSAAKIEGAPVARNGDGGGGSPDPTTCANPPDADAVSVDDHRPPPCRVGKWTEPEPASEPGRRSRSGLQKARSRESIRDAHDANDQSISSVLELERTSPPAHLPEAGTAPRPPAGLPSCHPRANTASAWLRYHGPAVGQDPVPKVIQCQDSPQKSPAGTTALPWDRPKPSFGRRQFGNYSNMSSVGCPKAALHSYAQNRGTIAASAFRQLRLGN